MRALLAVLLLLTLAFAGCASKGGGDDDPNGTSTSTRTASASGSGTRSTSGSGSATTSTGAPAENRAPTGSLTALVNGTNVEFRLNATDQDGDALTWMLAFGDDAQNATGTTLPANATHTYAAAGTYNATFTVTDGNLSASYVSALNLSAGAAAQAVVHSGSVLVPDPWASQLNGCLMDAGRRDSGGPPGITGTDHDIEETQWGWTYDLDTDGLIAEFWSAGAILGAGPSGTVPADAAYVVVCIKDPAAADSDYQLTLTPA